MQQQQLTCGHLPRSLVCCCAAAAIHGQRVVRLGKGIRPKDDHEEEVLKFGHRKRMIPNRSHQCQ